MLNRKKIDYQEKKKLASWPIFRDGRLNGFDIKLAKKVVESVKIPVVVASGAGNLEHIKEVISYAKPSGIAIASILHYDKFSIKEIKDYLRKNNIEVSK